MTFPEETPDQRAARRKLVPRILMGGKLRQSQVLTTFGPGAVLDLPGESIMIAGLDDWYTGERIQDPRLESVLEKTKFFTPATEKQRKEGGLPAVRFPRQLICAKCGLFTKKNICQEPGCNGKAYPARLVLLCPAGHADEFPWSWWVHRQKACTGVPRLKLTSQQKTAALSDLIVECETCRQKRSLSGALGQDAMKGRTCSGKRPWLIESKDEAECHEQPRSILRGATNVYFAVTLGALSIPPWSEPIQVLLNDLWPLLEGFPQEDWEGMLLRHKSLEGFRPDDVREEIKRRLGNATKMRNLRQEEYVAFCNPTTRFQKPLADFQIVPEDVAKELKEEVAQVILATRLREVSVLRGFTRLDPPDPENEGQIIAPIGQSEKNWLPAVEYRGEGVFVALREKRVQEWEKRKAVVARMDLLNTAYRIWREQRGMPVAPKLAPRLVLIHTLSHLLMRQLSLECGYSSSALRERLYVGQDMCGLLIYTATADADGSLGGLVQQGKQKRFGQTMQALLEHARWCSADPLCMEHNPSRTGKLNGASCHVCSLVAETSCERANHFLDRAFVTNLPGLDEGTGYFERA